MTEKIVPARPVMIKAMCECGGELKATFTIHVDFYKSIYRHKCDKCGKEVNLDKGYPTIEYREIDNG